MNEVPPVPVTLPRLGDDTPADRPQRKWEEFFWPNPTPPRPEAFDLLLIEKDRHHAYVAANGKESIAGEQAWRAEVSCKVKIAGLVTVATKEMAIATPEEDSKWRQVRERSPEEVQRGIERELAGLEEKRAAAKARAKAREEQAEIQAGAREHGQDQTEVEQEEALKREGQVDRVAEEFGRLQRGQVVPLRRETRREDREGPVEDREERAKPRVVIDLISDEDLYAKHFDPPVPLVKDLLIGGTLSILAGKPKIGKSFLALQIGRIVAAGFKLWDRETMKVPVLYLGLEDTPYRLKHRLIGQLGAGVRPTGGLHFATLWPRIGVEGQDGIAAIEQAVRDFGFRLIIVDTYARFRALGGGKRGGNAYEVQYDDLEPLIDFCKREGVAILLIHHTNKAGGSDVFDRISGSVALQGGCDTMMVLDRARDESLEAVLSVNARDFEGWSGTLEFEKVPGTWKWIGNAAVVKRSADQEAVLAILRELGGEGSASAVAALTEPKKTLAATRRSLSRMKDAGLIEVSGMGAKAVWKLK